MADPTPTPPAARPWRALLAKYLPWLLTVAASVVAARLGTQPGPVVIPPPPAPVVADPHRLDTPLDYEGRRYHGSDAEHVEANGTAFPQRDVRYWIDYSTVAQLRPALSNDMVAAAVRQAWGWWAESLDLTPVEVTDPARAHLLLSFSRQVFDTSDGPLGVLAACEMGDGTTAPKRLIFDAAERWTAGPPAPGMLSLPTVGCHEIGHFLGLGHDDRNAPAVMRPEYTAALPREQARDVERAVALGFRRRERAPGGPADVLSVPVQIRATDVIDALRKAGYTVTR